MGENRGPLGVIDLGSNTARLAVLVPGHDGALTAICEETVPLRLMRQLDPDGNLVAPAVESIITTLELFQGKAEAAGAGAVLATATSAVRDARNSTECIATIQSRCGVELSVLSGSEEANHSFVGAIHSLPARAGMVLDVGGGSAELILFRDRLPVQTWMFPLGALRLADRFTSREGVDRKAISRHAFTLLAAAGVPQLAPGNLLVGTGGTVRSIARILHEPPPYTSKPEKLTKRQLAGTELSHDAIGRVSRLLGRPAAKPPVAIPGLTKSRRESTPAGAALIAAIMDYTGATSLLVSGEGLREGLAYEAFGMASTPVEQVRQAALARWLAPCSPGMLTDDSGCMARIAAALSGSAPAPDLMQLLVTETLPGFTKKQQQELDRELSRVWQIARPGAEIGGQG